MGETTRESCLVVLKVLRDAWESSEPLGAAVHKIAKAQHCRFMLYVSS